MPGARIHEQVVDTEQERALQEDVRKVTDRDREPPPRQDGEEDESAEYAEKLKKAALPAEAEEEALATVEIRDLMAVINVPHARQVHVMFRGHLVDGRYGVGHESLEAELVAPEDIPWGDLAFPSVTFTLERYLADLKDGCERLHVTAVGPMNPR